MLYIVCPSLLCFSFDSKFCQKKWWTILYYFCNCKILVLSGASVTLSQAWTMRDILSNHQVFFCSPGYSTDCFGHDPFLTIKCLMAKLPFVRVHEWLTKAASTKNNFFFQKERQVFYWPLLQTHNQNQNIGHDQDHESLCIIIFHPSFSPHRPPWTVSLYVYILFSYCLQPNLLLALYLTTNRRYLLETRRSLLILLTTVPLKLVAVSLFWP